MPKFRTTLSIGLAALLASAALGQGPVVPPTMTSPVGPMPTAPRLALTPNDGIYRPQTNTVPPAATSPVPPPTATQLALPQRNDVGGMPLAPRGQALGSETSSNTGGALLATVGSLAVVLCLFFAAAYVLRRGTPHAQAALPGDVVEILGRAPLPGRHQMHLVRCGHKLLLVAVSTAGADTLTEITDPAEVDRLCGLCRQNHPGSSTAAFRNILNQFGSGEDA